MLRYFINRVSQGIVVIFFVAFLIYFIMDLMPGDPVLLIAGDRVSPEQLEAIRAEWQLDSPVSVRYFNWVFHLLQGNLGMSITTSRPVAELILSRLNDTLMLSGDALLVSYLVAIPIGLIAAYKKGDFPGLWDRIHLDFVLVDPFFLAVGTPDADLQHSVEPSADLGIQRHRISAPAGNGAGSAESGVGGTHDPL